MKVNSKSHVHLYFLFWFIIFFCSLLVFYVFKNESTFKYYFFATIIFSIFINGYEGYRVNNYLKKYNEEQYNKNRSFGKIHGVYNGFSAIEFLFSNSDEDDEVTKCVKLNHKRTLIVLLLIFISYPILMFWWK